MTRMLEGQMSIFDMMRAPMTRGRAESSHREWLRRTWMVADGGMAIYDRMLARFGPVEADRRSKPLHCVSGCRRIPGWGIEDAAIIGFEDGNVPCETVLDRALMASLGMPKDMVSRLSRVRYRGGERGMPGSWREYGCEFE